MTSPPNTMCSRFCQLVATTLVALAVAVGGCSSPRHAQRHSAPGAEKYLQDARAKLDSKQYTEAEALLEVARDEGAPQPATDALMAEVQRQIAEQAAQDGQPKKAYEHHKTAAGLEPDPNKRFADLMATIDAGRQAGIMATDLAPLASEAVTIETSSRKAQKWAAQLWDDAGKPGRALPYYQWLHKVSPDDVGLAVRLGTLYVGTEHLDEARRLLETVHQSHPDHVIVALKLANVYARQGDHARATKLFEKILAAHPKSTGVLFGYARYLRAQGDAKRANQLEARARGALPTIKRRKMRKLR